MGWRWIDKRALLLLHGESLSEHGGAGGMRDESVFDSALARPLDLAVYGEPDLADLAAAYASGIAQSRPFVDGNKRAAFLAAGLFLALNGVRLRAPRAEAIGAVPALAAGELEEAAFAEWLRRRAVAR
jgi:death-on-curing protein